MDNGRKPAGGSAGRAERAHAAAASADGGATGATTLPRLFAGWVAQYAAEPALSRRVDGAFTAFTYGSSTAARACSRLPSRARWA